MNKPSINFEIQSPSMKSPIPGESAPCGSSWHSQVEIRAPYRGMDKYVSILPIIQEMGVFPTKASEDFKSYVPDPDKAIAELVKVSLHNKIWGGIVGAQDLLNDYSEYIDEKNKAAIQSLISLAKKYYNAAKSLINFLIKASSNAEQWPSEDKLKIFKLLKASIENARCAQEAACSVGIYNRNKEAYESSYGKEIQQSKPKRAPSTKATPSLGGSAPEEPSVTDAQPSEPRKKKKDNTLLLAGAAALGLLMMRGK